MEVFPGGSDAAAALDLAPYFSGEVHAELLLQPLSGHVPTIAHTRCGPESMSLWHLHEGRQLLFIIEGVARVETVASSVEVAPGALVSLSPQERHRHGAACGSPMRALTITWGLTDWG